MIRSIIVALLMNALLSPQLGQACAPAPRPGQFVRIAEESAIIIWDEKTRTQHFIRSATFDTDAPDFGFLVPTPTKPALAEADNEAFAKLEYLIRPKEIEKTEITGFNFLPLLLSYGLKSSLRSDRASRVGAVRVLSTQRVAGYDAVVLEADNAAELNRWLNKHGYASSPSLTDWLTPYVAARWKITAFKIAKDADHPEVGTSAVRMSFTTDRPFFPYREPADQREAKEAHAGDRLLRIFLLSETRMEGTLGANASNAWPGQTVWTDQISEDGHRIFNSLVPPDSLSEPKNWLTVFEDKSSPRPGTDELYFAQSKQQGTVHPPPVINTVGQSIPVPLDLLLLLILIGGLILLMRRKRRRAMPSNPS